MHALIVEDEFFVADLIEDALRRAGFTSFAIADSAPEAIASAREHRPDLIVAEHRVAGAEGIGAIVEATEEEALPVVVVTARAPEVRRTLPGAVVVQKPFLPTGLQIAAEEAVRCPRLNA